MSQLSKLFMCMYFVMWFDRTCQRDRGVLTDIDPRASRHLRSGLCYIAYVTTYVTGYVKGQLKTLIKATKQNRIFLIRYFIKIHFSDLKTGKNQSGGDYDQSDEWSCPVNYNTVLQVILHEFHPEYSQFLRSTLPQRKGS